MIQNLFDFTASDKSALNCGTEAPSNENFFDYSDKILLNSIVIILTLGPLINIAFSI